MLNTKPQRMYFMYNVHPIKFTGVRKRTSRAMIGEEVRKLSRQFADSFIEVEYKKVSFASFEPDSFQETLKLAKLP